MKFYKNLMIAILFIGCSSALISEELLPNNQFQPQFSSKVNVVGLNAQEMHKYYSKSSNRLLATDFTTFDSLANSLSYCTSSGATPFVFDPNFNYLVTIKRGSREVNDDDWSILNSKNNLFLRISSDNGNTWEPQILLYDEISSQLGSGRYPSCATFSYNGDFAVGFTGSLVNEASGDWLGMVTGLWTEAGDIGTIGSPKCIANGKVYDWGLSDAAVHGYTDNNGQAIIFAANSVSSTTDDLNDNGNIGARKTVELDVPETWIPDEWQSSFFYPVDEIGFRPNTLLGLRSKSYEPNSPLYLGVLGNFKVTPDLEKAKLGFSISTDNGDTWQPFEIMDPNILMDYTSSLGIAANNSALLYDTQGFTVLSNGDVYFVCHFREIDDTKPTRQIISQLVEVKYTAQSQSWSISKITDISGLTIVLLDDVANPLTSYPNPMEIQLAKSVDESKLIVKWVDLDGLTWVDDENAQFTTSDIFYSGKDLAQGSGWSTPVNLTQSPEYDRQTHIPPIVPNGLTNIPILKLQTIFSSEEVLGTNEYITAMRSYLRKQYVQISHFNAVLGVDDDPIAQSETNLNRIYPNPAQNSTTLDYSVKGLANIDIAIYDLIGNRLKNIFSGVQSEGVYSFAIDTKDMVSGTYYITLKNGNKTISKILNIVK